MTEKHGNLTIVADAGRDPRGRRLVRCTCDCGGEIVARLDNVRGGHTKRCNGCRNTASLPPAPTTAVTHSEPTAPEVQAPVASPPPCAPELPPRGTPEWFKAQISSKEAAAAKLEAQANDYELLMASDGVQPSTFESEPPDRLWARCVNTAKKLRAEIARLTKELQRLESASKAVHDPRKETQNRIAQLRAAQEAKQ